MFYLRAFHPYTQGVPFTRGVQFLFLVRCIQEVQRCRGNLFARAAALLGVEIIDNLAFKPDPFFRAGLFVGCLLYTSRCV